jgi:hypothetical protein
MSQASTNEVPQGGACAPGSEPLVYRARYRDSHKCSLYRLYSVFKCYKISRLLRPLLLLENKYQRKVLMDVSVTEELLTDDTKTNPIKTQVLGSPFINLDLETRESRLCIDINFS